MYNAIKIIGEDINVAKGVFIISKILKHYKMSNEDSIERTNNILQYVVISNYNDQELYYRINNSLSPTQINKGLQDPDRYYATLAIIASLILLTNNYCNIEAFARIKSITSLSAPASLVLLTCSKIFKSYRE